MWLILEVFLPVVVVFVLKIYLILQSDSVKTTGLPGRPALTPTDAHACHRIVPVVHQPLYLVESQRNIIEDNRLLRVVVYSDERHLLVVVRFFQFVIDDTAGSLTGKHNTISIASF